MGDAVRVTTGAPPTPLVYLDATAAAPLAELRVALRGSPAVLLFLSVLSVGISALIDKGSAKKRHIYSLTDES